MNFNRPLTLASKSPRRHYLLESCGFKFKTSGLEVDENYPADLSIYEVAKFLARKKAMAYNFKEPEEVVITADTVVIFKNEILGKPQNREEAISMLTHLSGETHEVITGVCIGDQQHLQVFDDLTSVTFKDISKENISYYVDHFQPYDKAGAYGAQDWWGMICIEKLSGSYFNVVGLPTHKIYHELMAFQQ